MAITREQLIDLGFKPAKKSKLLSGKKYDTLIFKLNKTDYIYTGYHNFNKQIDFKRLWKTFYNPDTDETITYPVDKMGQLSYSAIKDYLEQAVEQAKLKKEIYG